MRDHEDLTQRLLGDISPDPLDLLAPPVPRQKEWLERLREPVTWGWFLGVLTVFLALVLILS